MNTVIFDMDGVLVDSEPIILRAAAKALAMCDIDAGRVDFRRFIGTGEENFITAPGKIYQKTDAEIQAMLDCMYTLYERGLPSLRVYPHAAETVCALHDAGFCLGLVSSSGKNKLLATLKAAKIPSSCFSVILSGSDVTKRKPDPEPYRTAALRLGKAPSDCLVIEDALSGIAAAKGAGMHCAAIPNSFSETALTDAGADRIIHDLNEILPLMTEESL